MNCSLLILKAVLLHSNRKDFLNGAPSSALWSARLSELGARVCVFVYEEDNFWSGSP